MAVSDRNAQETVDALEEEPSRSASDWFLEDANRGQLLLEQGRGASAQEVFQAMLVRLGETPSYRRAVVLERLGRCVMMSGAPMQAGGLFQQAMDVTTALSATPGVQALQGVLQSGLGDVLSAIGQLDEAGKAYEAAVAVAAALNDRHAEGVDRDHLGALLLRQGRHDKARQHLEAALRLFQEVGEVMPQAVARQHLGDVCAAQEKWKGAEAHYREAARLHESCNDWGGAAQSWSRLASVYETSNGPDAAEQWYRKAVDAVGHTRNTLLIRRHLVALARFLHHQAGRNGEAKQVAEMALATLTLETYAPDVWSMYGLLADITEKEAASASEETARAGHAVLARSYRNIEHYGPQLHATLAGLANEPGYARAVIMERLGRCFLMGGRAGLAAAFLRAASSLSEKLGPSDDVRSLQCVIQNDLGAALRTAGRPDEARTAYETALAIAEETKDRRAQSAALDHLEALVDGQPEDVRARYQAVRARLQETSDAAATGDHEPAITLHDEIVTDCVFDTDLLIDVARAVKITPWTETPTPLSDDVCPMLRPCARVYVDETGLARIALPVAEPVLERHPDCVVMRKTLREVAVSGADEIVWRLFRAMDGARTVNMILAELPADAREQAACLLADLAGCGVVDVSGRALGRFVHAATKKGVLLGGGLESDDVLRLATDGNYRTYAEAAHIALADSVPEKLQAFHALTRVRRSRRDYGGQALSRSDFEALLHTACGVTGAMPWEGRDLKLRAYPSSGALYAVEIYPVVLRVDELDADVYHYVPGENLLDAVAPGVGAEAMVGASLPVEREMVSGAAVMICLVGQFRRHERKYGEGGYRMMVAEAGHISQNLVLTATALGLAARPFGGVFDGLMNRALQLDEEEEQFLLAVLIGHGGSVEGTVQSGKAEDEMP